jgi:TatA/E family protein of Tat protein translocase
MPIFISLSELTVIFLAFLMLFGSKKIPELARGLGKGYRELQRAADEIKAEIGNTIDPTKDAAKSNPPTREGRMDDSLLG